MCQVRALRSSGMIRVACSFKTVQQLCGLCLALLLVGAKTVEQLAVGFADARVAAARFQQQILVHLQKRLSPYRWVIEVF